MKPLRMDYPTYMQPVQQQLQSLAQIDGLPISDEEVMFLTSFFESQGLTTELAAIQEIFSNEQQQFPKKPWLIQKGFGNPQISEAFADLADFIDLKGDMIALETQTGKVEGVLTNVQFNRFTSQLFVTLLTESGKQQFAFITLPEYEWLNHQPQIQTDVEIVKQKCQLILPFDDKKPFDDHFRIFTLFSALDYKVERDQKVAGYQIELNYSECEVPLVKQVLLQVCKKITITTPAWSEWLAAELIAMAKYYEE
ncbi:MAG: hypothetical protein ACRC6H_10885 [Culicoidibacterales bacterium]